jgi:hypothetical protein
VLAPNLDKMIDAGHGEKGSSIWFGLQPPPWNQTNVDGIKSFSMAKRASLATRTINVPDCVIERGILHAASWHDARTIGLTISLLGSKVNERTRGLDTRFARGPSYQDPDHQ